MANNIILIGFMGVGKGRTARALAALLTAGQYERLLALIDLYPHRFWAYRQWGVRALVALGRKAEAIKQLKDVLVIYGPLDGAVGALSLIDRVAWANHGAFEVDRIGLAM
mgnify:CR=1 FL=1